MLLLRLLTTAPGTFETSTDVRYTAAFGGNAHIPQPIVSGVVDGMPTGARGAAFESNELRNEPIRTRKDNTARVKERQYIPIKIALALVRRAIRDAVFTAKFSGEFAIGFSGTDGRGDGGSGRARQCSKSNRVFG